MYWLRTTGAGSTDLVCGLYVDGGIWRLISRRRVRLLELLDSILINPAALPQNILRILSSLPAKDPHKLVARVRHVGFQCHVIATNTYTLLKAANKTR